MGLKMLVLQAVAILMVYTHVSYTLEVSDFYDFDRTVRLENGLDKSEFIKLNTSINFFSDIYDHIYLNTKGVLTFGIEANGFSNSPFPLEFAAISPFYTNVDTTNAPSHTAISISTLQTERNVRLAQATIRSAFNIPADFRITNIIVATWENVGHFDRNNDESNTFQVAIISSQHDTYVEFLYPNNALNWLQSDLGESGLPDIRAQCGFVAEDGRFFTLPGSGSDNAKYLNQLTNHGRPGSWIYRIGPISYEQNIEEPAAERFPVRNVEPRSCAEGGRLKCHSAATCQDTRYGYSCQCKSTYYGNGRTCIKNDVPVRVSGQISGRISGIDLQALIQSYVVLNDGRSYTAINPLDAGLGFSSQLAHPFGYVIGWLFAKPVGGNAPNGYEITGGRLNHTSTIRYIDASGTATDLVIIQRYNGLNIWDQLDVTIEVNGNLPSISPDASISFDDAVDIYAFKAHNKIVSESAGAIHVNGENLTFVINQVIDFESSPDANERWNINDPIYNKVSKISANYQARDSALRIGMINKVVRDTAVNPCTEGSASCAPDSICVADSSSDSYTCECRNGFTFDESGACVDIDECATNSNICHENAACYNDIGGYSCRCNYGFYGNGYVCTAPPQPTETGEEPAPAASESMTTTVPTPNIPGLAPEHWLCDQCSEYARCEQGVCICKDGWNGNGFECSYNCPDESFWNVDRCQPISGEDIESELVPTCIEEECTCPSGYELMDLDMEKICRLSVSYKPTEEDLVSCDIEFNCHHNANCEYVDNEGRSKCTCTEGFEGNGYECAEKDTSCLFADICDTHASCVYDELVGKSECKCNKKYEGDGRTCQLAPECIANEDCVENSQCLDGVCQCIEGYDRDLSDSCVPTGYCGGAFCTENAVCLWDSAENVQYCNCPEGFVGDGLNSCKAVPPPCDVRNNCGLNAQCAPNGANNSYECVCNEGFEGDGFNCMPEVNCYNVPTLCHEFGRCISTRSGYQCICNAGYIGNGTYCHEPVRPDEGFLVLSQGVAIVKLPFHAKIGTPVAMSSMAIGIDNDCSTGRIYWSDISEKKIFSSKYDGTDKSVFISEDIISPEGVAIDWISRRIYWTDSQKHTIEVAALDDSTLRATVVSGNLQNPRGLAVDPLQGKLYWSDWNRVNPKIEQANLDGSDRVILLSSPAVLLPNSLTISTQTGELCFADAGTHRIECIEPYRRTTRTISSDSPYPFGLAITDENRLYWTDWNTKKIESSDVNGRKYDGIPSPLFGHHKMYGMTAVTSECPLAATVCQINNGDCPDSTICLSNVNDESGRTCQPRK